MKFFTLFVAVILSCAAANATAGQDKTVICHVGNKTGPGGQTYLDDPDCVPSDQNGYFCPDAGKIDLIVVANAENHLDNPNHFWDGFSDYKPGELGASGEGTEDTDGDGIDEGCEPSQSCPCWYEYELQQVTAGNLDATTCGEGYPLFAGIAAGEDVGFFAYNISGFRSCLSRAGEEMQGILAEEANACIEQIADRCAAIGFPIN